MQPLLSLLLLAYLLLLAAPLVACTPLHPLSVARGSTKAASAGNVVGFAGGEVPGPAYVIPMLSALCNRVFCK